MPQTCALSGSEGPECDGHAGAPLAECRAAERGQARRGSEPFPHRIELRLVQQPRLVTDAPVPENGPRGARVEEIALDEKLLEGARRRRPGRGANAPARLEMRGAREPLAA